MTAKSNWLPDLLRFGGLSEITVNDSSTPTIVTEDQWQGRILYLVGTLTDDRSIELPLKAGADWIVVNATDGNVIITATAASSTVTAAVDATLLIYLRDDGVHQLDTGGGSGGGSPEDAKYITVDSSSAPDNYFAAAAGTGISVTPSGHTFTIAATGAFGSTAISTTGAIAFGSAHNSMSTFSVESNGTVILQKLILDTELSDGVVLYDWDGGDGAYVGQIVDANVDAAAAIAGTKVTPAFGSQNMSTSGTLTLSAFGTAGVLHNNSSGLTSSSLIVNADVSASAAIAGSKVSPDFGSQNMQTGGTLRLTAFDTAGVCHNNASGVFSSSPIVNADIEGPIDGSKVDPHFGSDAIFDHTVTAAEGFFTPSAGAATASINFDGTVKGLNFLQYIDPALQFKALQQQFIFELTTTDATQQTISLPIGLTGGNGVFRYDVTVLALKGDGSDCYGCKLLGMYRGNLVDIGTLIGVHLGSPTDAYGTLAVSTSIVVDTALYFVDIPAVYCTGIAATTIRWLVCGSYSQRSDEA